MPCVSLVDLCYEALEISKASRHQSAMNVVEFIVVYPQVFGIVHDKFDIRRYTEQSARSFLHSRCTYNAGWPGLRSMPITFRFISDISIWTHFIHPYLAVGIHIRYIVS